jgi:histidinol dehydrogenase
LRIIEGFQSAKATLSRAEAGQTPPVSPALKQGLEKMFGVSDPESAVKLIIDEVRRRGDAALLDYTQKIDGVRLASLEVSKEQISCAYGEVDGELVSALKLAAQRISAYHTAQKDSIWKGVSLPGLRQMVRPLERVGIYTPGGTGGTTPLPSSVLMTVIPARVADVKEIILATPPGRSGSVPPLTLVAADIARVDRIFSVGGAQAIAAMAYGTETIPRVDKVCGPGNIFVFLAKKLLYGTVGIDGLQGPSDVLVIADETASAEFIAADLLAQAEHDPLSSSVLVTDSHDLAEKTNEQVKKQLGELSRQAVATESLENRGLIAVVASMNEAIDLANLYAPEHLCLMVNEPEQYIKKITNAGCIAAGKKATVVLGDYVAGPSHVLPTEGTARFSSPLSVLDFVKLTSVIIENDDTLKELGGAAQTIAKAEGLDAHAKAVERRLKGLEND